jgi:hypothetical protein
MSTSRLFAIYEVQVGHEAPAIPAFFIESTAPNNLDDKDGAPGKTPEYCVKIPTPREAIDRIAEELARQPEPKLVIPVHGFNSPRDAVLETYKKSFLAVNQDTAIHGRGVVCVGYRWPSERMGTPWPSALTAAPWFLLGTLFVSLGAVYFVSKAELFSLRLFACRFPIFIPSWPSGEAVITVSVANQIRTY